ncbi:hypothetical protein HEP_00511700, partial [Hepatocystis sp. ex Piliocolobus tephrosceles]
MQLKQFLFFNALLYSSCVLAFKSDIRSTSTALNVDHSKEIHSEEATGNSKTNLLFTNKKDFSAEFDNRYALERDVSLMYLLKVEKLSESEKRKFKYHVIAEERYNKKAYDKKNAASIENIKISIKHSLQIKHTSYPEYKINSMVYRIYQRVIDFYVYYYGSLSLNCFNFKEWEHTQFWSLQIWSTSLNTNFNIRDY